MSSGCGIPILIVVAVPTGKDPSGSFWHSVPSTANEGNSRTLLALMQGEC